VSLGDFYRAFPFRSVCEVTREIHDIITAHQDRLGPALYQEIFGLLQEQMAMQKKMDGKLRQYRTDWDADMWAATADFEAKQKRREANEALR